jgi:ribokinase
MRTELVRAGRSRLLVAGSANHDTVLDTDRIPRAGETVVASSALHAMGGKGANQAVAAASLGRPTDLLAAVGDDCAAEVVRHALRRAGVGTELLQVTNQPTGQAVVLREPDGDNRIVVASGANAHLDVGRASDAFQDAAAVLCQLETPLDTVRTALTLARRHGAMTVLNAAPAVPGAAQLLPLVDILIVNEQEATDLAGIARPGAAATRMLDAGPSLVVVTRGAAGALMAQPDGIAEQPAFAVPVVDTTGAGDCFTGALVHALLGGAAPGFALRTACAAGALATTRAGAGVLLDQRDIDALTEDLP